MTGTPIINRGYLSQNKLKGMIAEILPGRPVPKDIKVITDTSNYFRVDYNNVVILDGRPYLIRHNEREGRFGIEDQPKYWVKRAIDLESGKRKVMKMVFYETFTATVGKLSFERFRSPLKEARILDLVKYHPRFMQGFSTKDSAGNIIRIIDRIPGKTLAHHILDLGESHEEYFFKWFPSILDEFIELAQAINFLHLQGEKHGDIRRDHIIKDTESGRCQWIDFDYDYVHKENIYSYDLFGLGNIIAYLTGHGEITSLYIKENLPAVFEVINEDDLNIIFNNRVMNLKKVYPYIPDSLNNILLHFSSGSDIFYDETSQFIDDLREARSSLEN